MFGVITQVCVPRGDETNASSVQIGALVPLTRPGWVEAGQHLLAGLELAVGEVNEAGGIAGRPLELVVRDTAADPQRAAAAVEELAALGVAALAGEYHSVVARAAAARADALGLPFLCSSAVIDALTEEPTERVARLAPAQSHGWQVYADFLLGAGHSRIAVAAEPSVYWASGARILRDYLAPCGDVLRSHGPDRARIAGSWPGVAVEGMRGQIRFCRTPGISVWQWAWAPVQVVDRDPAEPGRFRILHTG
ncbi:ABC transporter substrate-binding protein [Streptomyces sp. NPDC001793]|uniref:ABC transporter substrate-binding protein n=1 Tax=Streptomyces sp. NPDC001793 TaxID=3154657 RepID=UPI00331C2483